MGEIAPALRLQWAKLPEDERLVIEAKVSTIDIDRVAIGQTADINFSAFKMRETKRILGRLINLSADSIVDENDPEQRPYYQAIVEITREGMRMGHRVIPVTTAGCYAPGGRFPLPSTVLI